MLLHHSDVLPGCINEDSAALHSRAKSPLFSTHRINMLDSINAQSIKVKILECAIQPGQQLCLDKW